MERPGPWTFAGTGNWAGWGSGLEGGALVRLANGVWRIYFDQYGAGRYYYADSSNLSTFTAKTELPGLSGTVRHLTVLREDAGDNSALPTGNHSLQSANNPARYIRHRDNYGYVEELTSARTATARQDGTFKIVAGLAHPSCYSLESVNYPGYYLRHYDFVLALQRNDGGAIFAGDATFCSRAGFAGGASFSLESYNHPGRYLRHANYALRIDQHVTGGTFAGDASFTVTAPLADTATALAGTSGFRGVNWADARDNYVDGWVIPTGLLAGDGYATVRTKSDGIIAGFQSRIGANTVRLPINPQSVNSDWWARYKGEVDSALGHQMKVILSYWEADTSKNGTIDDVAAWNTMWDTVIADYGGNAGVHFEPMNEPFA